MPRLLRVKGQAEKGWRLHIECAVQNPVKHGEGTHTNEDASNALSSLCETVAQVGGAQHSDGDHGHLASTEGRHIVIQLCGGAHTFANFCSCVTQEPYQRICHVRRCGCPEGTAWWAWGQGAPVTLTRVPLCTRLTYGCLGPSNSVTHICSADTRDDRQRQVYGSNSSKSWGLTCPRMKPTLVVQHPGCVGLQAQLW